MGLVAQAGASCTDWAGEGGATCTDKRNIVLLIPRRNVIIYIVETNGIKIKKKFLNPNTLTVKKNAYLI